MSIPSQALHREGHAGTPRAFPLARARAAVLLIAVLAASSCSSEPEPETSIVATPHVTTTAEPTAAPPSPAAAEASCEELAAEAAQGQGDSSFVEAGGAQYIVQDTRELPDNRVLVDTAVDQPGLVGYAQVLFLSYCGDDEVILMGAYVPTDGSLQLLFTTNEGAEYGDVPRYAP